jgi:hypothetical protein
VLLYIAAVGRLEVLLHEGIAVVTTQSGWRLEARFLDDLDGPGAADELQLSRLTD